MEIRLSRRVIPFVAVATFAVYGYGVRLVVTGTPRTASCFSWPF